MAGNQPKKEKPPAEIVSKAARISSNKMENNSQNQRVQAGISRDQLRTNHFEIRTFSDQKETNRPRICKIAILLQRKWEKTRKRLIIPIKTKNVQNEQSWDNLFVQKRKKTNLRQKGPNFRWLFAKADLEFNLETGKASFWERFGKHYTVLYCVMCNKCFTGTENNNLAGT